MTNRESLFPVFLKLAGRRVLVVGGGPVAASKLAALAAAGAVVHVVAPDVVPEVAAPGVAISRRPFVDADLDDAWFVVAAATPEVNRQVADAAESRHVFVNAVDDLASASAYLGGVVRKAGVTLAISTDGRAPALAGLLREGLEAVLPDDLDQWHTTARAIRPEWQRDGVPMHERRPCCCRRSTAVRASRWRSRHQRANTSIRPQPTLGGPNFIRRIGGQAFMAARTGPSVSLVGAGPGDPALADASRALALLPPRRLVLYDALVPDAIVALASAASVLRRQAGRAPVGPAGDDQRPDDPRREARPRVVRLKGETRSCSAAAAKRRWRCARPACRSRSSRRLLCRGGAGLAGIPVTIAASLPASSSSRPRRGKLPAAA
jgi:uroporphyrin-III C-methyltransferase/precorrin-2 dehydrogenase/sirohydrochlorin ferrochelatase